MDSVIPFGQYKGNTIRSVIEENPQYILWCIESIDWIDFEQEVIDEANTHLAEYTDFYPDDNFYFDNI